MVIEVLVKPRSRERSLEDRGDFYVAKIKSVPEKGRANDELIDLVAESFSVTRDRVQIKSGSRGKKKLIEIKS